jgi:hypothetical protein
VPPPGDDCEDPIIVTGPYPVTVPGTNVDAAVDCPRVYDWHGIWYHFELPYEENDVVITLCSLSDLDSAGIFLMDDCNCDDYLLPFYYRTTDACTTLHFHLPGPSWWYYPARPRDHDGNPTEFEVTFNIADYVPCVIDCVPNEGEETCYDGYLDTYNGGCYSPGGPVFQPIECGETICGTSGFYLLNGLIHEERDWFEFTVDSPSIVECDAVAEFPVRVRIAYGDCFSLTTAGQTSAFECTPLEFSTFLQPGTYYLAVEPAASYGYPCGVKYETTLSCEVVAGACCYDDGASCVTNEQPECDALGGTWRVGEDCDTFQCPTPCEAAQIDIQIMTDRSPEETTWEIVDNETGALICSGGPYQYGPALYEERCCIAETDCVDLRICDSNGDGIHAPGGHTVWLNGDVISDTMGEGWYGHHWTIRRIGGGCVDPTGACCVDEVCLATTTWPECYALDGQWWPEETCPEFECFPPWPPPVYAPYTSELRTTCGAGNDCNLRSTEDHEYRVIIPNAGEWNFNTCLDTSWDTYIFLGTALCTQDLGYNDDSCGLQSEIIVYLEPGDYYCTIEGYSTCGQYIFDVHEELPCVLECPDDAQLEPEPCGEDTNGGCLMDDPAFEPIACNDTVCGTGWFDGSVRDTDWYEFVATGDDLMHFTVEAEFDVLFGRLEQIVPGQPGCDNLTGLLDLYELKPECSPASVEFPVTAGGTYYLFVGAQLSDVFTCDSPYIHYVATLTGENCICGDFDNDGDVDVDDFFVFLDAFGTCEGDAAYEEDCDFDGDECITLVDYQTWIQCYYDASG